jgi:hypothetical protein
MKRDRDFKPSGTSFVDRIGEPDEFDAAMGRIALAFSFLEDTARNVLLLLSGTKNEIGNILAAELSFRQKLDVTASLARQTLGSLATPTEQLNAQEDIQELVSMCRRSAELRNTYLHSSYAGRERAKLSARGHDGLRVHRESVDAALLLDVADFITYAGMELECLPLLLGVADNVSATEHSIVYLKDGSVVATFKFGEVA